MTKIKANVSSFVAAFALFGAGSCAWAQSTVFDVAADFSATANSNGPWSYGWSASTGSAFNLDTTSTTIGGVNVWRGIPSSDSFGNPSVSFNPTSSAITLTGTATWLPMRVAFHPGIQGQNAVVRWTASAAGAVAITALFEGRDFAGPTTTDIHVLRNGSSLFSQVISGFGTPSDKSFAGSLSVFAGDTIDFTVGFGSNGNYNNDTTQLDARIVFAPVPEPASYALITLGGLALVLRQSRRQRKRID